jgi:transmembrane sensor
MSNLRFPLKQHLPEPDADQSEASLDRIWKGIRSRLQERPRPQPRLIPAVLAGMAAGVAMAAVVLLLRRDPGPLRLADGHPMVAVEATGIEAPTDRDLLSLSDGSHIQLYPGASLVPLETSATTFSLALRRGSAAFDVRPGGPRRWTVECGLATVEVIGTRFACERSPGRLRVRVEHGVVLVRSERLADRAQRLAAGEALDIVDMTAAAPAPAPAMAPAYAPATAPAPAAAPATASATSPATARPPVAAPVATELLGDPPPSPLAEPAAAPSASAWRDLAVRGRHGEAFRALGPDGVHSESRRAGVDDLMALADVARLSGHPAAAVEPLERVLSEYSGEPQAPLAAFALGRLELDSLGRPERAARALERALALGIASSLREDVRARLVEALVRTGDRDAARAAAAAYAKEFPRGRHAHQIDLWLAGP